MKRRKHLYGARMNVYRIYVRLADSDGKEYVQEYVWQGCNHIDLVNDLHELFRYPSDSGLTWYDWDAETEETDVTKFEAGIVSIGKVEEV